MTPHSDPERSQHLDIRLCIGHKVNTAPLRLAVKGALKGVFFIYLFLNTNVVYYILNEGHCRFITWSHFTGPERQRLLCWFYLI